MINCKEIENNLPLYLDNSLSRVDKQTVEEHLKSCPQCAKAFAQLQKTEKLVNNLTEIDPPPWFKQKIMAKVREESEKKNLVQKWFYPLQIKIPVQILPQYLLLCWPFTYTGQERASERGRAFISTGAGYGSPKKSIEGTKNEDISG